MSNLINNIIKINRGDTYDLTITIAGDDNGYYKLIGNDKLYFALMESGDEFEDAFLYKTATEDTTPIEYDQNGFHVVEYHFVIESNDTAHVLPDTYYYTVKLEMDHDVVDPDTNRVLGHVSGVYTVINRTKFIIMGATEIYGNTRQQHAMTLTDQTFTENGTYLAGNYGADGFRQVTVALPLVRQITVTENGTYDAPEHGGFEQVVVDVQPQGDREVTVNSEEPAQIDTVVADQYYATITVTLDESLSDSIVEGVSILGVQGTHRDAVIYAENTVDSIVTNVHDESLINTISGNYSAAFGAQNLLDGDYTIIAGGNNDIRAGRSAILGTDNTVVGTTSGAVSAMRVGILGAWNEVGPKAHNIKIIGENNTVASFEEGARDNVYIIGNNNASNATQVCIIGHDNNGNYEDQIILGKYNYGFPDTLVEVGSGTSNDRRSNLRLTTDDSLLVGAMGADVSKGHIILKKAADSFVSGWANQIRRKTYGSSILGSYNQIGPDNTTSDNEANYIGIIGQRNKTNYFATMEFGSFLTTSKDNQVVLGTCNAEDSTAVLLVGDGTYHKSGNTYVVDTRSNAFAVYSDHVEFKKSSTIGETIGATTKFVDDNYISKALGVVKDSAGNISNTGNNTFGSGVTNSVLIGYNLTANTSNAVAIGKYNYDGNGFIFEVGAGEDASKKANFLSVDSAHNAVILGQVGTTTEGTGHTFNQPFIDSVMGGWQNTVNKKIYGAAVFGSYNTIGPDTSTATDDISYCGVIGRSCKAAHSGVDLFGTYLTSTANYQTVVGRYNATNIENVKFGVGVGTGDSARKNAFTVTYNTASGVASDKRTAIRLGDTVITEAQLKALLAMIQ